MEGARNVGFMAALPVLHWDLQDLPYFSPILTSQSFLKVSITVLALSEVLCKRFPVNEKMLIPVLCEGENV